ncbi:MAG: hypothetical protein JXA13_12420 [Anaerolineales bacterium]|nr:hypothetical protein [Anaerolineales bacterium]
MDFLLDPNLAYLVLVVGVFLGLMAIVTPGTGALEAGTVFCAVYVGYVAWNTSINPFAFGILLLSLIPFVYAIQKPKRELFLALAILGFVIGSAFLFNRDSLIPAVNPVLAGIVSVIYSLVLWFILRKTLQAVHARPAHDLGALIGQVGEAKTEIYVEGSVQVDGELWSARSEKAIPAGSVIRVVAREGFVLLVEKAG